MFVSKDRKNIVAGVPLWSGWTRPIGGERESAPALLAGSEIKFS